MLGVLITWLASLGATFLGAFSLRKLLADLDPAARFGIAGLIGLGALGFFSFFADLAIGRILVGPGLLIVCAAAGVVFPLAGLVRKDRGKLTLPQGIELLFPLAIGLALLMCLIGVLAPSDTNDWDSLAYHLAVPKMWLRDGHIHPIGFIHQSNFPFTVESLYMLVLNWGGQAGAKAFSWTYTLFGAITLFGLARARYGQRAGWWTALAFTTVPVILWESGSGYIDVANGLYAGLGLIFVGLWLESGDRKCAWLSAILLGFAAGTKYTGLQTIFVAGLVALVGAILLKRDLKPVFLIGLLALAIGSPWYVKNAMWKDNPVFPFFYSKLGGKDWDQRRADIYTREQNSFGVGRSSPPEGSVEPARLGHSVLGLAYQPGRYINPVQTMGMGDPLGAIGVGILGALVLGLFAGQRKTLEKAVLVSVLLSLGMWFVLTQQSRYIVALAVPLSLIAGQVTTRKNYGVLMAGAIGLQAAYSLALLHQTRFSDQLNVVLGKVSQDEYMNRVGFYPASKAINDLGPNTKTALYDEVFGYLLDVPYYWANPGHSTEIPYDSMQTGKDYADGMRKLGFTHVYMNLSTAPELIPQILGAMQGQPFRPEDRKRLMDNWEVRFKVLIPEAVASGELEIVQMFGREPRPRGVLLRLR